MFIGHFGLAFAAKRAAPRTSLGATFVAAQLADLIWPILLLAGVETVSIVPGATNPFLTLEFTNYPWSHSLATGIGAGIVAGALYYVASRYARGAVIVALLVPSHWVLDFITHVRDLPLYPGGSARVGLGLWRNPVATIVFEVLIYALGVAIYARTTRARDRVGSIGLWLLVIVLLALYVVSNASPPPASLSALAWGALIGWPLMLWPWWVDRRRDVLPAASGAEQPSA